MIGENNGNINIQMLTVHKNNTAIIRVYININIIICKDITITL